MGSAQFDRERRGLGAASGRARMSTSPRPRSATTCTVSVCASRRSSAGPNAAGVLPTPRQPGPPFPPHLGTGPEVVRVFAEPVLKAEKGLVEFAFRHRVDEQLIGDDGAIIGSAGRRWSRPTPSGASPRRARSSASSSSAHRRSSSPPAGSATTTNWSGRIGRPTDWGPSRST